MKIKIKEQKKVYWKAKSEILEGMLSDVEKQRFSELGMPGANSWLHCLPVKWRPNLLLPKKDFQDALLIRFNKTPNDLPVICPANSCQEGFTLTHADICIQGGVIHRRHDYVKIIIARYAEKAFGKNSVEVEPVLGSMGDYGKDFLSGNLSENARADLAIRDFNGAHRATFIDVSVVSPVCASNKDATVVKCISKTEAKKNNDYSDRIKQQLGGEFMPCVFSSGGGIGPAAKKIIDRIANRLASNSLEKIDDIKSDIKTDIVVSLLKSRIQGLRCSRNSITSQLSNFKTANCT